MSTPMRQALSQQGRTPGQSQPHGAVGTPSVSTPFSAAHLTPGFSPHGPKSSPQQVKKSPAPGGPLNPLSNAPMNFDSPSTAAVFGSLPLDLNLGMDNANMAALVGPLGRSVEDDRIKRLDEIISILSQNKGVVSEAGLERLVKKVGMEYIWEDSMGEASGRTLIVAGSSLELLINITDNVVQSVALSCPDSGDVVNSHAPRSGQILFDDLKLAPGQSPLTKRMDRFAANFERLALLDKHSINPGLNLFQAVAGMYASLDRLHQWEMQKVREDASLASKNEGYLRNLVLCTKSGIPAMNAGNRVGLRLDYWTDGRLHPVYAHDHGLDYEKTHSILIGCAPRRHNRINPVRISENWISADIVQAHMDELQPGRMLDWQQPEDTLVSLSQPELPGVAFTATFDPPIHVGYNLWEQIHQLGCVSSSYDMDLKSLDNLLLPVPPGTAYDPSEPRYLSRKQRVPTQPRGQDTWSHRTYSNTLEVPKPGRGATLSEIFFSHPQELVSMLPYLRAYAFLATLLENSFGANTEAVDTIPNKSGTSKPSKPTAANGGHKSTTQSNPGTPEEEPCHINVTLLTKLNPRLEVSFPFDGRTGTVEFDIRENGHVHILAQNVLGEKNAVAPDGRQRRQEDLEKLLETMENIGHWCEFLRTRWTSTG